MLPVPLNFLEDHLVHPACRCRRSAVREDRPGCLPLQGPDGRSEEKRFGFCIAFDVETAGEELAAGWGFGVVSPGQSRDRIEQG